ncbi:MAG: glycosyltransferase family 2 protein [Armatimonadota bacterium]|nr:glycosyltransferase family 2 protein [Armatimonadota bacterium]
MSEISPVVSCIIISYNTRVMTLECLQVLFVDLGTNPAEVWVVDNASTDGSPQAIREAFPQVKIIENHSNSGFGAANNQAMQRACGQFLLLLNSDAFLKPGAISTMVQYLKEHPRVGVVGPRLLNKDGSLQRSCFRFSTPGVAWRENLWISAFLPHWSPSGDYRRWKHDRQRNVDFLIGACMLVRREVFDQVGGFDERFFMYSEEADWQKRIWNMDWEVVFVPTAEVTHLGGASGAAEKARINQHFFDSLDYYEWKHHGLRGLVSVRLAMIVGGFLRLMGWGAVFLILPRRRAAARAKIRLLRWLTFRQATRWRLPFAHYPGGSGASTQ